MKLMKKVGLFTNVRVGGCNREWRLNAMAFPIGNWINDTY